MIAVEAVSLGRSYEPRRGGKPVRALDNFSIQIDEGEIHGLLGPNGAGKTTFIKILSTLLLPSEGSAFVLGRDVTLELRFVRSSIGIVLGGDKGLHSQLSARETLLYWSALYGVPRDETKSRIAALLERVGLTERGDAWVETYSRGMKQRLHLARGLIANAPVLFLDEPTIGMDPLAALDFRKLIADLRNEGRTILLTTHDMAEAEAVCDRVSLIDHGRLIAVETPATLGRLLSQFERVDFGASFALAETVRSIAGVTRVSALPQSDSYRAEVADRPALSAVLAHLVSAGVTSVRTSPPSLEEVYIHLIGERGLEL
ncbi:MAG: ABC transporter ATP-binding protein [Pseudomonadota bacterium]